MHIVCFSGEVESSAVDFCAEIGAEDRLSERGMKESDSVTPARGTDELGSFSGSRHSARSLGISEPAHTEMED